MRLHKPILASLVCMLIAIALSGCGLAPGLFAGSYAGWICFDSGQDIWVMRTDGSELTNVTNTISVSEGECRLSWDSSKILYVDNDGTLYVSNRNGTGRYTLLANANLRDASWSPDGSKILYVAMIIDNGAASFGVHMVDIASGADAKLYESSPGAVFSPVMSPDGRTIAFSSGNIYTMNWDGSDVKEIVSAPDGNSAFYPAWSRDGRKLAMATVHPVLRGSPAWAEYGDIYVVNSDGSGLVNVTKNAPGPSVTLSPGRNAFNYSEFPSWTNANQIVFLSSMPSHPDTLKPYIMNADGSGVKLLVDQETNRLDYQPDAPSGSTPVPTTAALARATATAIQLSAADATATSVPSECAAAELSPQECANLGQHMYVQSGQLSGGCTYGSNGLTTINSQEWHNILFQRQGTLQATIDVPGGFFCDHLDNVYPNVFDYSCPLSPGQYSGTVTFTDQGFSNVATSVSGGVTCTKVETYTLVK